MSNDRIRNNIRSLRKAYGETQLELAQALNSSHTTISGYETGQNMINQEAIQKIAKHFGVPVDELLNGDFSADREINIDTDFTYKHIDIFFPIVSTETALTNDIFKRTVNNQKSIYDGLKRKSLDEFWYYFEECIGGYEESRNDNNCLYESAANMLGLLTFHLMSLHSTVRALEEPPAATIKAAKNDSRIRSVLGKNNSETISDIKGMLDEYKKMNMEDSINELIGVLKSSSEWSQIGDYYLAQQFVWGILDNNLDPEINCLIGREIMFAFASMKNHYAVQFIKSIMIANIIIP